MEDPDPPPSKGPAFGVVNAESITEGIQNCHVSLEESRLRLAPLANILDPDDDGVAPGGAEAGTHTDGKLVQEFLQSIEHVFASVGTLVVRLADSGLIRLDRGNEPSRNRTQDEESVYILMASNCITKASEFVSQHSLMILEADSLDESSGPLDDRGSSGHDEEGIRIQPCMARLTELALRVAHTRVMLDPSVNDVDENDEEVITLSGIIEAYSQYQRRCLRTRSKPAISSVAELRRVASNQNCYVSDLLEAERKRQQIEADLDEEVEGNEDGDGNGMGGAAARGQPHAQAITVLLGEASSLIQPLAAWRDAISMQPENERSVEYQLHRLCQESTEILDSEAQTLAATVGSWFGPDQRGVAILDDSNTNSKDTTKSDLLSIESSLEEMAFLCQVISRYCSYSQQILSISGVNDDTKLKNLLTEQSLHYSTLETRLATLQFNQAISLASPQLIELGRPSLQVPSIVEDAHFLCVRAIERAAGTRSERAVWTVGHWVCEVWGVDQTGGMMGRDDDIKGVYRALMEGIGCTGETPEEGTNESDDPGALTGPLKVDNAFAAALLDAVDDDVGQRKEKGGSIPGSGPNSAPASGGLSTLFRRGEKGRSLQGRVNAELCALNGISAAETACSALSQLFSDLIEENLQEDPTNGKSPDAPPKSSSMLTFARDELASHSRSYHTFLQRRIRSLVSDLCGGDDIFDCDGHLCLQNLRLFSEKEVYNLDSSSFRSLEGEDRLEAEMIGPVRRSQIFQEISADKCDATVVLQMAEAMSWKSAEIILQVLLQGSSQFNEWGAMLLSKQIRMLQHVFCGLVLDSNGSNATISTASILSQFERVNQAVAILQLEKPSDWLAFAYKIGDGNETNLTRDEIQKVMSLRVDFSEESIARVCMQLN
ncbi:hypothetical protein ACHAWF_013860 [Thalassiosira exigua]